MVAITALNGALPPSLLTHVTPTFSLRPDAASSYLRCRAAGCPAGITTAYRTRAEQQVLFDQYGYPHAEYPGHSQHGEGVALDLPEPARSWMAAHGRPFGWVRTITAEAWHFEYKPALDVPPPPKPAPVQQPVTPTPAPEEFVMATAEQVAEVVRAELAKVARPLVAFRATGTTAAYLDLGSVRRHASGAQLAAHGIGYVDLPVTDPFWRVPIQGTPGEVYRVKDAPAAYSFTDGGLHYLTPQEHIALGRPPFTDLPADHPLWSLPKS